MTIQTTLQNSAKVFSNVFSPPAVSAAFGFLVAWQEASFWPGLVHALAYGAMISLLPVVLVVYLLKKGKVDDLHMSLAPEQRRIPYLVAFLGALAAFLLLYAWGRSPLLITLAACNVIGLAALGLMNNLWLVSNHSASVMMVAAFSVYVFGLKSAIWSIPLVAVVIWSRWLLRKHTLPQLALGLLVGAAPVFIFAGIGWLQPL